MTRSIDFNFSQLFEGIIWNTVITPSNGTLLLEVRNTETKLASFSAMKSENGAFFWKDVVFDEPWWVSLNASAGNLALFSIYLDTNNPDKKGIFAYDIGARKILWWNNDFSLIHANDHFVRGTATKYGNRDVILELENGLEVNGPNDFSPAPDIVLRPSQYTEDHAYFITVKTFLSLKFNLLPVVALEYLEYDSLIFISVYIEENGLANYLMIMTNDGDVLIREKLDEHLKGIGLDTFFIYAGCVFFVRNKRELFSYKIV